MLPLVSLANLILIFLTLFYMAMLILNLRHLVLFLLTVVPFCLWGQWREVSVFSISGLSSASALLPLALFLWRTTNSLQVLFFFLEKYLLYVSFSSLLKYACLKPTGLFFLLQEPWNLPFHGNSHPPWLLSSLSYTTSHLCWDSNPDDLVLYFLSRSSESTQKLW